MCCSCARPVWVRGCVQSESSGNCRTCKARALRSNKSTSRAVLVGEQSGEIVGGRVGCEVSESSGQRIPPRDDCLTHSLCRPCSTGCCCACFGFCLCDGRGCPFTSIGQSRAVNGSLLIKSGLRRRTDRLVGVACVLDLIKSDACRVNHDVASLHVHRFDRGGVRGLFGEINNVLSIMLVRRRCPCVGKAWIAFLHIAASGLEESCVLSGGGAKCQGRSSCGRVRGNRGVDICVCHARVRTWSTRSARIAFLGELDHFQGFIIFDNDVDRVTHW